LRRNALRLRSDANSPAQSGHSHSVRFRSFPLDADSSANSCGYQIQAQLPATVISHFAHRRLFMPAIQILAHATVNDH
jgi:hypothetical protein